MPSHPQPLQPVFGTPVRRWLTGAAAALAMLVGACLSTETAAAAPNAASKAANPPTWSVRDDGAVVAKVGSTSYVFEPRLTLLFTPDDPKLALRPVDVKRVAYNVPTWNTGVTTDGEGVRNVDTDVAGGDGLDPSILAGDNKGRTSDFLRSAPRAVLTASGATRDGDTVTWTFDPHPIADVRAVVQLDAENGPLLQLDLTAKREGWYSLGYTGAPAVDMNDAHEIWQPLIWQEKRLPDRSYATAAFQCPLPGTLVQTAGATLGVMADPSMLPFQPLPLLTNSQFAVVLRNENGQAQPMVFAPVLGGMGSELAVGQRTQLQTHFVVHAAPMLDAFQFVARTLCKYENHRENLDISLNDTLANMVRYAMSEYARFNQDLRGCAYDTDVPNAVKNVSTLQPLEAALVFDDAEIYDTRVVPTWEYMMSREKLLFNLDESVKTQNPSAKMTGPCANVSELAALHSISKGRDFVSRAYAEQLYGSVRTLNTDVKKQGNTWTSAATLYEATGKPEYAKRRDSEVARYLKERIDAAPTDFSDRDSGGMFFWTSYAPLWIELYNAWRQNPSDEVLAAVVDGALHYTQFTWMLPVVPDGTVRINEGGLAPHYWYLKSKGHERMKAAEKDVPAWWVDALGLTPESSGTASGHRGILIATYAPWMLRVAHDADVPFLRDVARSAMVGRYRNFPGYHINTARTDVYMQADYPLREHKQLGYNSFHYNHIWPMISMLIDYLVSDTYAVSDGAIDFPAHYSEGYAYLRQNVYGDRPGRFYDRDSAILWMPLGLVSPDNPQLNYIAARNGDELLVAFTNQSAKTVRSTVRFDADRITFGAAARVVAAWKNNKAIEPATLSNNTVEVEVSPHGITAIAITGCSPKVTFQDRVLTDDGGATGPDAHKVIEAGDSRAMIMTLGPTLTHGYAYSRALQGELKQVVWKVRPLGGDSQWHETVDTSYPFEVSFPIAPDQEGVELVVEATAADGTVTTSDPVSLKK